MGHMGPALGYEGVYLIGRFAFSQLKLNMSLEWLGRSLELRQRDPVVAASPRRKPTVGTIKSLINRGYHGDAKLLANEMRTPKIIRLPPLTNDQANYIRRCQYKGPYHIEFPDYKAMKCLYKPSLVPYNVFK